MTSSQVSNFISAVEDAGVTKYYFVTDTPTNFHNNENAIVKLNGDLLVNFRKPQYAHYRTINGIEILAADVADVHEARAIGTADQLKQIAQTLGVSLSDDEYKLLINVDKKNVDLVPATGNYIEFVFLPKAEYDLLSDAEKAAYDEAKKFETTPLPKFRYLGHSRYEMLSDEDKQSYDEIKNTYEEKKAKELPKNQAASFN
ncbi:MAG: hypothetical protein IKR19_09060 [Acholeplasmatales bacterium]|nr:hypothetical protein [Acholeplasmatales bacterium]